MNPLQAHWLRLAVWLLIGAPVVAAAVALTTDEVDFSVAIAVTLYMWVLVCVILALIALAGLIVRLCSRGLRAIRR